MPPFANSRLTTKLTGAAARRTDQRWTGIGKIEGGRCRLRLRPVERLVRPLARLPTDFKRLTILRNNYAYFSKPIFIKQKTWI